MDLKSATEKMEKLDIMEIGSDLLGGMFKKTGRAYKRLCPFHEERHASFYIYPDTQTYVCYGCGRQGKILGLIKMVFNGDGIDILEYLRNRGCDLGRDEGILESLILEEENSGYLPRSI